MDSIVLFDEECEKDITSSGMYDSIKCNYTYYLNN